jgi:hypothetical protein
LVLLKSSGGSNRRELASFDDGAKGKAIGVTWVLREGPPVHFLWKHDLQGHADQLKLEGKDHELVAGRIFVLDRTAQPPKLLQIGTPIPADLLLDPADTKANRAKLERIIGDLKDQHEDIAEFAKAGFQYELTAGDPPLK